LDGKGGVAIRKRIRVFALGLLSLIFSGGLMGADSAPRKIVLFFGDSLTAGYGLPLEEAYPALIQEKINTKRWPYEVVNAGLSGDTTAGGRGRISWVLKRKPDVVVIALGANDGLRGVPVSETKKNLEFIVDEVRRQAPQARIVIAGMKMPPSLGATYADSFEKIFSDVAKKKKTALIPFLLEGVAAESQLNQADGIHPTAQGQRRMAETVWAVVELILKPRP
jgi:acyl-CoA thioesterase-1